MRFQRVEKKGFLYFIEYLKENKEKQDDALLQEKTRN